MNRGVGHAPRNAWRKKHRRELVETQDAADLREGEEWNKGHDQHQHASADFVGTDVADLAQTTEKSLLVNPSLDEALNDSEQQHEDPEQDRFVEHRHDQGLVFETPAEAEKFADEDDLGDDQRLDQCDAVMKICNARFGENQPSVHNERAEEYPQVNGDDPEELELLDRPLLETGFGLVFHIRVLRE